MAFYAHTTILYNIFHHISRLFTKESDVLNPCGIIAEYNPFHNGHAHLVAQARAAGCTHIAAVMSGNFTQRGDFSLLPKHLRAAAALQCGVDLVLELPLCYASARAQTFALGGVQALQALGVSTLCFGSESADLAALSAAAEVLQSPALQTELQNQLQNGVTFAAARQAAAEHLLKDPAVFQNPNDTLAVEYIAAAKATGAPFHFLPIRRAGVGHDTTAAQGGFLSASAIRQAVLQGNLKAVEPYMPAPSFQILGQAVSAGLIANPLLLERAILCRLRTLNEDDLAALPDVSEGLHHRLYSAIRSADSLEALYAAVKTKRYTLARIRRLVLAAFLGLYAQDTPKNIPYLRVLACNSKGQALLAAARKTCSLPIALRATELKEQPLFALECRADDLYALSLQSPAPCGTDFTQPVFKGE